MIQGQITLRRNQWGKWWRAFRSHYVPPSFLPAILGSIAAWVDGHRLQPWLFVLVLLGVTINHIALNMSDDYFDYLHAVDTHKTEGDNPYTGGSGTLTAGLIKPGEMLVAFSICYLIVAAIGLYLTAMRGWPILAFGLFGMACSYFYTAPPIKFGYHGWGELGLLVNFGWTIGLGAYFVAAQRLSWPVFWGMLPLGLMMFSMITINEIPDHDEDLEGGKLTLVARFGRKAGTRLYMAGLALAYLVIIAAVAGGMMPLTSLIALLTAPIAVRSVRTLLAHYHDPVAMAPANLDMIKVHSYTGILLILAYCWHGVRLGNDPLQMVMALVALAILWSPVALLLWRASRSHSA